uniref:Uncharacterized protein n=1 Tax=Arundo donax TaxID=35708 RepID=A0A0A9KUK7_ARUDO
MIFLFRYTWMLLSSHPRPRLWPCHSWPMTISQ